MIDFRPFWCSARSNYKTNPLDYACWSLFRGLGGGGAYQWHRVGGAGASTVAAWLMASAGCLSSTAPDCYHCHGTRTRVVSTNTRDQVKGVRSAAVTCRWMAVLEVDPRVRFLLFLAHLRLNSSVLLRILLRLELSGERDLHRRWCLTNNVKREFLSTILGSGRTFAAVSYESSSSRSRLSMCTISIRSNG